MAQGCDMTIPRFLVLVMMLLSLCALPSSVISAEPLADSPGMRMLEEIQSVITDLAEQARPSVVNLFPLPGPGRSRDPIGERAPNVPGSGSGLIVDPDGYI